MRGEDSEVPGGRAPEQLPFPWKSNLTLDPVLIAPGTRENVKVLRIIFFLRLFQID